MMTIRKSIRLEQPPEVSFRVFCDEMSLWWPGGFGKGSKVFLEGRSGGRYYERDAEGKEYEIGRVTEYQPPSLLAFSFKAPSWEVPTLVTIRFSADGRGTRLDLEHSGWEQNAKARESIANYERGWDGVLGHFSAYRSAA
jgi:uncharacterized protein YndB with AHSA1/START domain